MCSLEGYQGWTFISCSHCQELCQQGSCMASDWLHKCIHPIRSYRIGWLLIGCTRVNNQSEVRTDWLLIDCKRINNQSEARTGWLLAAQESQSEARSASWPSFWPCLQLKSFHPSWKVTPTFNPYAYAETMDKARLWSQNTTHTYLGRYRKKEKNNVVLNL